MNSTEEFIGRDVRERTEGAPAGRASPSSMTGPNRALVAEGSAVLVLGCVTTGGEAHQERSSPGRPRPAHGIGGRSHVCATRRRPDSSRAEQSVAPDNLF